MLTVTLEQAKDEFTEIIGRVLHGHEEVLISDNGRPVARVSPIEAPPSPRKPGLDKGKIWMSDDFDAPLPDEIVDDFYQ